MSVLPSLAVLLLLAAGSASGQEAAPVEPVALDKLLELPSGLEFDIEERGGDTRGEWRERFLGVRDALANEQAGLAEAQAELDEVASASSAWALGVPIPGVQDATKDAPLDFELRQRIKHHREEIEHLERRLQELEIEANLAGVPEEWRH